MNTNQSTSPTPNTGDRLWGIYFTDREYAHKMGDPLLGVVAAPTKIDAEKEAVRRHLPDAWAHPLTDEQVKSIQESEMQRPEQPRITMQPTTAELRTAIEVLKALDQRINDHATHSVTQLPESELGERYAAHIEAQTIEQTSHVEKVVTQLQNWREELLQKQNHRVAHSV